ncbi:MAG: DMT family transporter [Desulfobacteraceae bacterium]
MKKQTQAYFHAAGAVLIWSTVASAFKISLRHLDFLQLLLLSSMASTIALLAILILQNKIMLMITFSKKEYLHSALLGFLNPFLYYVFLFKAYELLPAQEAQPLNYTWPIMLVLLSIPLLGQKISVKSLVAIIISFFGVLIISTQGNLTEFRFTNLTGALLALSTAVIWALFWIYNIRDKRDEVVKLCLNFLFGFIYIFITVLLFSKITVPDIKAVLGSAYIGLFEMGLTFVIWSKALSLSKTTAQVSKLIYLVPFLSLVVIYFAVGERILPSTITGLILIVSGIVLEELNSRRK